MRARISGHVAIRWRVAPRCPVAQHVRRATTVRDETAGALGDRARSCRARRRDRRRSRRGVRGGRGPGGGARARRGRGVACRGERGRSGGRTQRCRHGDHGGGGRADRSGAGGPRRRDRRAGRSRRSGVRAAQRQPADLCRRGGRRLRRRSARFHGAACCARDGPGGALPLARAGRVRRRRVRDAAPSCTSVPGSVSRPGCAASPSAVSLWTPPLPTPPARGTARSVRTPRRSRRVDAAVVALADAEARLEVARAEARARIEAAAERFRLGDIERSELERLADRTIAVDDIPTRAYDAYVSAARTVDAEQPGCRVSWWALAAIGRVESGHGTSRGAVILPNGDVAPRILGPALTGGPVPGDPRHRRRAVRRRPGLGPSGGPDAVHPLHVGALGERRER